MRYPILLFVFFVFASACNGQGGNAAGNGSGASAGSGTSTGSGTSAGGGGGGTSGGAPGVAGPPPTGQTYSSPDGIDFIKISAGTFTMGYDSGTADEAPSHSVTLTQSYYLGKYSVTYGQWVAIRDWALAHGYDFTTSGGAGSAPAGDPNANPVVDVTWYSMQKWMNALSEKEGRSPAYYLDAAHTQVYRNGEIDLTNDRVDWNGLGYRLPTEAEFEMACRGGTTTAYWWGDVMDMIHEWWSGNSGMQTHPVGLMQPNPYGLYDIAGNTHQFLWGKWPDPYSGAALTDPRGQDTGWAILTHGGAFMLDANNSRCSFRRGVSASYQQDFDATFRIAFTAGH